MEGAAFLAGGAFGPDGPCLGLRVGSFLAGGTTDLGPGFATGMVGSRGAVIAAAIRADGEIMTGTAAFTGGGAFMAFGNSFTFRDGGAGFGPADERLIPNTGGVGAFDLDRPGAGDFAWSGIVLVFACSKLPGGADACCGSHIESADKSCAKYDPPCVIGGDTPDVIEYGLFIILTGF